MRLNCGFPSHPTCYRDGFIDLSSAEDNFEEGNEEVEGCNFNDLGLRPNMFTRSDSSSTPHQTPSVITLITRAMIGPQHG